MGFANGLVSHRKHWKQGALPLRRGSVAKWVKPFLSAIFELFIDLFPAEVARTLRGGQQGILRPKSDGPWTPSS